MGSNVIFDTPYLDRYLRFGWYLYIIMLLLLRDASLMFGPDSVVHMDDWDYPFYDRWLDVTCFSDLSHIWCPTRAYSVSDEIYRSSWNCMLISTYEVHTKTRTCSLFIMIPWWSLSWATQPAFNFQHLNVVILLLRDMSLLMRRSDSVLDLDYGDQILDDGWFHVIQSPTYHISDAILWHIFVSIEICRSSWSCMLISTNEIRTKMMTYLLSYHDPLVEPL